MANEKYQVDVQVNATYLPDQSLPAHNQYVFAYTVTLLNRGSMGAKLLSRHWIISDANGGEQEVRGEGVVGEQPHLNPGESFQYTSGTPLTTPMGSMRGSYQMVADDGTYFEATIPPFALFGPATLH
ncbi:ApaG domain protein [Magnetococcus marinus MC-1]|uniref:Protein ApaG n=1 Tax=Magnetococcus marinus (strain ATCC BAA-1437 / JCM 17883 / MC-1) TaxID=156889 RepID=A0LA42_MAGMM|nr:Co2+/Mg2+ efflux protein ApaG [Magnetococcus marinus]ABK44835.1 ApaG domain protein [Magnetococcus marinus MC-1]